MPTPEQPIDNGPETPRNDGGTENVELNKTAEKPIPEDIRRLREYERRIAAGEVKQVDAQRFSDEEMEALERLKERIKHERPTD